MLPPCLRRILQWDSPRVWGVQRCCWLQAPEPAWLISQKSSKYLVMFTVWLDLNYLWKAKCSFQINYNNFRTYSFHICFFSTTYKTNEGVVWDPMLLFRCRATMQNCVEILKTDYFKILRFQNLKKKIPGFCNFFSFVTSYSTTQIKLYDQH